MATLYRNFPGRRELLEALYTDEVNAICEAAEAPGASLLSWLRQLFAFFASKRHIAAELLKHTDSGDSCSAAAAPESPPPASRCSPLRNRPARFATTSLSNRSST